MPAIRRPRQLLLVAVVALALAGCDRAANPPAANVPSGPAPGVPAAPEGSYGERHQQLVRQGRGGVGRVGGLGCLHDGILACGPSTPRPE